MNRIQLTATFRFEASHVLPKHPGKCSRLHGHSWVLGVSVSGPVDPSTGFVVDYAVLKELVKAHIIDVVDHQHLGQGNIFRWAGGTEPDIRHLDYKAVFGDLFYPSSENLVVAFARILGPLVQELGTLELSDIHGFDAPTAASIQLEEVTLDETCTCRAIWRRQNG